MTPLAYRRLFHFEWDKATRWPTLWGLLALQWLLGCLPVMLSYNREATPSIGLPSGLPQSFLSGMLFTGVLISGVLGAIIADFDAENQTRLLLITSGYPRIQTLGAKGLVGGCITIMLSIGQLLINGLAAEVNAIMGFQHVQSVAWPSLSVVVTVLALITVSFGIGFAGRIATRSLLMGVGIPVLILFGERYLAHQHAQMLAWLPNFSLSNAIYAHPLRWPGISTWIPLAVWMTLAVGLAIRYWQAELD